MITPEGVSAELMTTEFQAINPSSIDAAFIDKCTHLPQEVLDAVPTELREYTGDANDRKALMQFKRQRAKALRTIVHGVRPCQLHMVPCPGSCIYTASPIDPVL